MSFTIKVGEAVEHKMLQPFGDSYAEEKKILPKTENFPLVLIAFLPIMHQKKAQEKKKRRSRQGPMQRFLNF